MVSYIEDCFHFFKKEGTYMKYRKSLKGIENMVVPNKSYPNMPIELQPFHYYFKDSGHVIMCVPNQFKNQANGNFDDYEVGVPVKYVLSHTYKIENGYIFIDVLYNKDLGIVVDEKYDEF